MTEDWKVGYQKALFRAFVKNAGIIGEPHYLSGDDIDWHLTIDFQEHMKKCGVSERQSTVPEDSQWTQWGGTFGKDYQVHGLDAKITCQCRKYKKVHVRMEGTFGELLQLILREDG